MKSDIGRTHDAARIGSRTVRDMPGKRVQNAKTFSVVHRSGLRDVRR